MVGAAGLLAAEQPAVEPVALAASPGAAGSLVLRSGGHSAEEYNMDEITLYQWGVLGFLALIAVLIWRVLLAVEAVEKNTLQDNGSPAP